jgi:LmbE family N-acetylglucosaminyl deacetylase
MEQRVARTATGVAARVVLAGAILATVAACGDNTYPVGASLEAATDLTIVAHQDDDLLFMQPDLFDAVRRGTGVTNVYVTAGNGRGGIESAERRYGGLMAAYGALAGSTDWSCGALTITEHEVEHCRLAAAKLSLVFVGCPDGGKDGEAPHSLLHLWRGQIDHVTTIARRPSSYRRDELVAMLAEIIDASAPTTLRTLEIAATHGHDHADHMMVGALALAATAASSRNPELISYRGYNVDAEPSNAAPALLARDLGVLAYYEACAAGCAPCGQACVTPRFQPQHVRWMARRYAIGMRRATAGTLRFGDRCLDATTGDPTMVDCATAPTWQLEARGTLRSSAGCLRVQPGGAVVAVPCAASAGPGDRFLFDDDGHLWSGLVPTPEDVTPRGHASCMTVDGDRPRARTCGAGDAPIWELARAMTTPPDGGSDHAARWVADLDGDHRPDWCAASPAGPRCSLASDDALTTDSVAWGYALAGLVEGSAAEGLLPGPDTAVVSDIDGDGRADLCTTRDGKIACARSLGHGFGPRTVIARLPAGMVATALWAEPMRLCAADATTTACTPR